MIAAPQSPPCLEGSAAPRPPLVTSDMTAIERDWKRLQHAARPANPFLSWEWQSGWAAAHPHGVKPLVVGETFPDGSLAGLLALQRVRRHGLAQMEMLGQGAGGDELDCLVHPAAPAKVGARLLRTALAQRRWSLLRLESVRTGGVLATAMAAMHPHAPEVEAGECLPTLALPASFDALLAARSPNFRAEVRRRRRSFARLAPQASLECAESPVAVAAALGQLMRLHNQRRAQKQGRGIFARGRLRAFHRRVAVQLAAAGVARIYLLHTPGAVVAALYGLEAGGRFLYFQSGFDPAWAAASPGTMLLSGVIEDCIARGLTRFEFLRGEERYKRRWTAEQRHSQCWLLARGALGHAYLGLRRWRRAGRETELCEATP